MTIIHQLFSKKGGLTEGERYWWIMQLITLKKCETRFGTHEWVLGDN
jgi:hypothetical protein